MPTKWKVRAVLQLQQSLRYLRVPLSGSTYAAVDWSKLLWSGLYFYGYMLSVPFFISILFGWLVMSAVKDSGMSHANWFIPEHFNSGMAWALAVACCAGASLYSRLVIYPYSVALLLALKRPTPLSRAVEMNHLMVQSALFYTKVCKLLKPLKKKKLTEPKRQRFLSATREPLIRHFMEFRSVWASLPLQQKRWSRRFRLTSKEHVIEIERLLDSHEGMKAIHDRS